MGIIRLIGVAFLSVSLLLAGNSMAVATQPVNDELLSPLPSGVWIRGTKVKLVDTKLCWSKSENPVLYAKVREKFEIVARGKLVERSDCVKTFPKFPYQAEYRFTLKSGGDAKKLILRSSDGSEAQATFKRTVYSSVASYNKTLAEFYGVIEDLLSGGSNPSNAPPSGSSQGSNEGWTDCSFNGKKMWGTVKIVDAGFADFDVKIDELFPDLKVKESNFPMRCGEWRIINSGFADFSIKFVNIFEDFSIKFVNIFPGR